MLSCLRKNLVLQLRASRVRSGVAVARLTPNIAFTNDFDHLTLSRECRSVNVVYEAYKIH